MLNLVCLNCDDADNYHFLAHLLIKLTYWCSGTLRCVIRIVVSLRQTCEEISKSNLSYWPKLLLLIKLNCIYRPLRKVWLDRFVLIFQVKQPCAIDTLLLRISSSMAILTTLAFNKFAWSPEWTWSSICIFHLRLWLQWIYCRPLYHLHFLSLRPWFHWLSEGR